MDEQTKRKINLKIYPIYRMFSLDLLFYYAISFLFLTQIKGISAAQILLIDAFYPLFQIIFQPFSLIIADRIGKRKSLILGNSFMAGSIFILIVGNGIYTYLIFDIVMAFGYVIKELCGPILLNDSIPENKYKLNIFTKIEGKGTSHYWALAAISSIITGFLYVTNPYLPMIICLIFCLLAALLAFAMNDIENYKSTEESPISMHNKEYIKTMQQVFKFIFKSTRLRALLLSSGVMMAFANLFGTYRSSLLVFINVPAQYFGIILASAQILTSIASKKSQWIHMHFKDKTLTFLSLPASVLFLITGLLLIFQSNNIIIYISIFIMIALIHISKGPYSVLIKRYFNSFSSPDINTKIYTAKAFAESIIRLPIFLFASFLLYKTTIDYAIVILGAFLVITFILLSQYMKTRIGLNPEEYNKKDIEFHLLK